MSDREEEAQLHPKHTGILHLFWLPLGPGLKQGHQGGREKQIRPQVPSSRASIWMGSFTPNSGPRQHGFLYLNPAHLHGCCVGVPQDRQLLQSSPPSREAMGRKEKASSWALLVPRRPAEWALIAGL